VLTSALSWRAVLLVNAPLAIACVAVAVRSVAADPPRTGRVRVDVGGAALICLALVGLSFGFSQTQLAGWGSPEVLIPLVVAVIAGIAFVLHEHRVDDPLMDIPLLRSHRNYLGATISQGVGGLAEMGLGVIFPLLLILNLGMDPALAGLALIPTTVPMIVISPLAGRWYDRSGGRPPLVTGYAVLLISGLVLAWGADGADYLRILPGLLLYGIGLALVLTVNDPVSLDSIPDEQQGQASGVSATAEQGFGALGIAVLYALFHGAYVSRLHELVDAGPLQDLTDRQAEALRAGILAAESTGLRPEHFDPSLVAYLFPAEAASEHGYAIAFLAVSVVAAIGLAAVARLVRKPA
jgi:MFS family permease